MTDESREFRDAVVADWRRRAGRWIVALSGGVDSAVLLQLAVEGLGPQQVLAVTGASAAVAVPSACPGLQSNGAPNAMARPPSDACVVSAPEPCPTSEISASSTGSATGAARGASTASTKVNGAATRATSGVESAAS